MDRTLTLTGGISLRSNDDLLDELLRDKRSPTTRRGYESDLKIFFEFLGLAINSESIGQFLGLSQPEAIRLVLSFKAELRDRNLKPNTINRKLAAVKSLVSSARRTGRCRFTLDDVDGEKVQAYRDTTGVDSKAIAKILGIPNRETTKGKRDYAILRLLWGLALRRSEVVSLSVGDVDLDSGCVWVLGKGKCDRERMSLGKKVREALVEWLKVDQPKRSTQPLFISLARNGTYGDRLSDDHVYKLVRDTARAAGISKSMSPHKIRHSAITAALDNGADVRSVKRLSRHSNIQTLITYDDNRQDLQKSITDLLEKDV
ncbi:MAG: tyrosine-type recombinase/integrase [Cyanobacteria bacterium J06592_8]